MNPLHEELKQSPYFQTGFLADGAWQQSVSAFENMNPATNEKLADMAYCGKHETQMAIDAATKAFPLWRSKTATERGVLLRAWYDAIMKNIDFLAKLMTAEQGKPLSDSLIEVEYAASFILWFSEEARRVNGEIIPPIRPHNRIFATREPVGVLAAITPCHFPMAMLTRKLGPALAAGCTALIKPANDTPLCAWALLALAHEAGIPHVVLNGVCGDTHAISDTIMESFDVRKITFTGSTAVGKLLVANAAATMKRTSMELGGNAPLIVFEDADIDAAISGLMANKFRNAGQVCIAANRIFVHDSIYDDFCTRLLTVMQKLVVGNGIDKDVTTGPLINMSAIEYVEHHIKYALDKGGQVLLGGKRLPLGGDR